MSTTNETNPLLVPALVTIKVTDNGTTQVIYDRAVVDAVVEELQRQLRVATMPTDRATGITGEQSDHLVNLISDYVSASIDDSWKGGGDPAEIPEIEANLALASKKLNEYLTLLRAPV